MSFIPMDFLLFVSMKNPFSRKVGVNQSGLTNFFLQLIAF